MPSWNKLVTNITVAGQIRYLKYHYCPSTKKGELPRPVCRYTKWKTVMGVIKLEEWDKVRPHELCSYCRKIVGRKTVDKVLLFD